MPTNGTSSFSALCMSLAALEHPSSRCRQSYRPDRLGRTAQKADRVAAALARGYFNAVHCAAMIRSNASPIRCSTTRMAAWRYCTDPIFAPWHLHAGSVPATAYWRHPSRVRQRRAPRSSSAASSRSSGTWARHQPRSPISRVQQAVPIRVVPAQKRGPSHGCDGPVLMASSVAEGWQRVCRGPRDQGRSGSAGAPGPSPAGRPGGWSLNPPGSFPGHPGSS